MGLNDIKLSPTVVTALYESVLVQDAITGQPQLMEPMTKTVSEEAPESSPPPVGKENRSNDTVQPITGKTITEDIQIIVEEDDPTELLSTPRKGNTKPTVSKEITARSLGGNQKNILVVVNNSNVIYLPDEDLEFLTNILNACKLSLDDVAVVNTNNTPGEGYKEYLKNWSSKIVLLFGVDPVSFDLPVNFPEFQVQSLNNTTFLYSPALSECGTNKLLKSKLWVSLQRIFGL
jgi:hypothetical protein